MKLHIRGVQFITLVMAVIFFYSVAPAEEQARTAGKEADDFRNRFSLFGGMTQEGSDHGASVGLEYEYRLGSYLGVGGLAEYAGGDFDSWVLGVPFFIHIYAGWVVWLAPGVEIEDSETNFLFRAGMGYEFEIYPRWSLAPEVNFDFTDGDTKLVYGFTLTWRAF